MIRFFPAACAIALSFCTPQTGKKQAPGKSPGNANRKKSTVPDAALKATRKVPRTRPRPRGIDIASFSVVPVAKDLARAAKNGVQAVYILETKSDAVSIPQTPYQKVQKLAARKFRVTVTRPKLRFIGQGVRPRKDPKGTLSQFLNPTPNLQSNAPMIVRLAGSAIRNTRSAKKAAIRLTRFVHDHIVTKGYSLPAATALDVARLKQGDCTEHAYLLAASGRAVGLPSRVASGLVYANRFGKHRQVFVYHMWTEFLIADRWVPFDATRPGEGVGVTHILLATDAMSGMLPLAGSAALMHTLGQLRITVKALAPNR